MVCSRGRRRENYQQPAAEDDHNDGHPEMHVGENGSQRGSAQGGPRELGRVYNRVASTAVLFCARQLADGRYSVVSFCAVVQAQSNCQAADYDSVTRPSKMSTLRPQSFGKLK